MGTKQNLPRPDPAPGMRRGWRGEAIKATSGRLYPGIRQLYGHSPTPPRPRVNGWLFELCWGLERSGEGAGCQNKIKGAPAANFVLIT